MAKLLDEAAVVEALKALPHDVDRDGFWVIKWEEMLSVVRALPGWEADATKAAAALDDYMWFTGRNAIAVASAVLRAAGLAVKS